MRQAAVLGQGSIGRRHAANLLAEGLDVVAFDPAGEPAPDVRGAATEAEALDGADVCVVASPSSEHLRQARMALEAGVATLVEKPLALDAEGARQLEALAAARGVPLGVAMNMRFHPGVLAVRGLLRRVGRVWRAAAWCGSWLPGWRPEADYRRGYSARRELGGGVLLDAIHEVDYLTWLLGSARAVRATLSRVSDLELDVEDVALLTLELESGALATVNLDYLDRAYHRGCRIVGSEGTIAWEWASERVSFHPAAGEPEHVPAPADAAGTYPAQLRAFLAAVRDGSAAPTGAAEARRVLEVADAARASTAAGGVRMPLGEPC